MCKTSSRLWTAYDMYFLISFLLVCDTTLGGKGRLENPPNVTLRHPDIPETSREKEGVTVSDLIFETTTVVSGDLLEQNQELKQDLSMNKESDPLKTKPTSEEKDSQKSEVGNEPSISSSESMYSHPPLGSNKGRHETETSSSTRKPSGFEFSVPGIKIKATLPKFLGG